MTTQDIIIAEQIEQKMSVLPQIANFGTIHSLYAGVYTRTIALNQGEIISGALIKIPTTLILSGNMSVFIGSKVIHVKGVEVIIAEANRKQIMHANGYSVITMIFKTEAQNIDEAEQEFTDDYERLVNRTEEAINIIKTKETL